MCELKFIHWEILTAKMKQITRWIAWYKFQGTFVLRIAYSRISNLDSTRICLHASVNTPK